MESFNELICAWTRSNKALEANIKKVAPRSKQIIKGLAKCNKEASKVFDYCGGSGYAKVDPERQSTGSITSAKFVGFYHQTGTDFFPPIHDGFPVAREYNDVEMSILYVDPSAIINGVYDLNQAVSIEHTVGVYVDEHDLMLRYKVKRWLPMVKSMAFRKPDGESIGIPFVSESHVVTESRLCQPFTEARVKKLFKDWILP